MHAYLRTIWVALLLAFAGCSPGRGLPVLAAKPEISAYRLGPGDTLQIRVLGADELNGQYSVQDDGTVSMLMAGAVPAEGFTAEQVQTKTVLHSWRSLEPRRLFLCKWYESAQRCSSRRRLHL